MTVRAVPLIRIRLPLSRISRGRRDPVRIVRFVSQVTGFVDLYRVR